LCRVRADAETTNFGQLIGCPRSGKVPQSDRGEREFDTGKWAIHGLRAAYAC
jgi:hypothetical protein